MSASYWHLVILTLLVVACAEEPAEEFASPVSGESGQPFLSVDHEDLAWLSWIEPTGEEDEYELRYASFDGSDWSESETAARGNDWFVNWADVPSVISLPDGRLAAHYLVSSGPHVFAYDVHITQKRGGGAWQEAITPHTDGTQTEHGFVTLLPWSNDDMLAVWLDGREMDLSEGGHGRGAMTLRGAIVDAEGVTLQKDLVDDHVCECCPTSGVRVDDGALIAYRNRTEDEIRNISLVRFDGEGWGQPYDLHDDGWEISGCPVNGPALDEHEGQIGAAWFTAANDRPQVRAAFSDDEGASFSEPITVDDNNPGGQVDLAFLKDGSAVVSWHGKHNDQPVLMARRIRANGEQGKKLAVVEQMSEIRTGIPRMVRQGDHLLFAWVGRAEREDYRSVQMERLPISDVRE